MCIAKFCRKLAFFYDMKFNNSLNKFEVSTREKEIFFTPDWYHNFEILGIATKQPDQTYIEAQKNKQNEIFNLIKKAITLLIDENTKKSVGMELFCADAFYANYALQHGAEFMYGVDLAEMSGEGAKRATVLEQAKLISKVLGHEDKTHFECKNVFDVSNERKYDFVICAGGLYHLENPEKLIKKNKKLLKLSNNTDNSDT